MSGALKDLSTAKIKRDRSASVSYSLRELRGRRIGFDAIEENNESPPSSVDRQPPVQNDDDDDNEAEDDDDYDDDKDLGASWNKNLRPKELRLASVSNWLHYKEDLLIEIQSIGYEFGMRLAPFDEIKLAGAIRRTTTSDARTFIRGTKIMKLFEATFQQVSELQQDNYWEELSSLKYRGDCPITYITKFKTAIHNYRSVGDQVPSVQAKNILKASLSDTSADVHATNFRENLIPETIVEIKSGQFPVQTGNGVVHDECMGEVLLPLMGAKGEWKTLHLKHVLHKKELLHNLVSDERFYKRGGRQEENRLVNCDGTILTDFDVEMFGVFRWLNGCSEPLKSLSTSITIQVLKNGNKNSSINEKLELVENQEYQAKYKSCVKGGVFDMSDEIMRRLVLWQQRLCHPSADRLKWTIRHAIGIDLDVSDVKSLPCEACDMGKSLKYTTRDSRSCMEIVGEDWHCDIGSLTPVTMDGYKHFCLTTEDVSRYRIFKSLKHKNEAGAKLKAILSKANIRLKAESWIES
ncbi:hypothetical protein EPUL_001804 [Erysiphe pulchra]|uniref:GAG-pre-integrase domain-containing protein n=1 Tax=Erysiphe pulchra TaxID=225359 RepID=A0A2S4PZW6_9PEZI|nr:hypothetical protein EPUL_001804 [Erysiphe pulchra]